MYVEDDDFCSYGERRVIKVTDNEIVKFLNTLHDKCLKFPIIEHISNDELLALFFAKKNLDCQQEKIAEKDEIIKAQADKIFLYEQALKDKTAEIERLEKLQNPTGAGGYKVENGKVVFYSDMLNGYRHEYKDLNEIVKELNLYMHTDYKNLELISHYQHKAKTAKSETIKEFAERLKEKFTTGEIIMRMTVRNIIDNTVKEMTENEGKE